MGRRVIEVDIHSIPAACSASYSSFASVVKSDYRRGEEGRGRHRRQREMGGRILRALFVDLIANKFSRVFLAKIGCARFSRSSRADCGSPNATWQTARKK